MILEDQLKKFEPYNEQEAKDKEVMLNFMKTCDNVFTRENEIAHFTASAWVLNKERNKVLMIYHNIYDSWAWTGGHADGEVDLLKVAITEVMEETGVTSVKPIREDILSVEILTVDGHVKRGKYVSSHLHMNLTYLLEADDKMKLEIKPDENSGVKWVTLDKAVEISNERCMKEIYRKLNKKCRDIIK